MTVFFLVRHGETVWHADSRYTGTTDIGMTDAGYAQADRLGSWAATADLTEIWASTLTRAQHTAEPSVFTTGLPLHIDPRIREAGFGIAEGFTMDEMALSHPEQTAAFLDPRGSTPFPGGEQQQAIADRFVSFLQERTDAAPDGRILVVSHSTAIRHALCALMGIPLGRYRLSFPTLGNVTVTELRFGGAVPGLVQFNAPL